MDQNTTSSDVLDQLFAPDGKRFAISSGNGVSYLLHTSHSGVWSERLRLLPLPDIEPSLARWVREVAINSSTSQQCQGDPANSHF
jgi:hypothetical protein